MNSNPNSINILTASATVLFTYIGALFTYELVTLYHSGEFTLGVNTLRFDPYLAILAVGIVLIGQGIVIFRTHPAIREHLMPGTFSSNERIIIESLTLVAGVNWYAQSNAEGVSLLAGTLFATILALSAIAGMLLLLRWAYLGTEDQSKAR